MADDERRAEIEAAALNEFAAWLREWRDGIDVYDPATQGIYDALDAVLARFDRVRDARDDDEAGWKQTRYGRVRATIGEPFGPGVDVEATRAARSPQDEDHEENA